MQAKRHKRLHLKAILFWARSAAREEALSVAGAGENSLAGRFTGLLAFAHVLGGSQGNWGFEMSNLEGEEIMVRRLWLCLAHLGIIFLARAVCLYAALPLLF